MSISKVSLQQLFCLDSLLLDRMEMKNTTIDLYVRNPRTTIHCIRCQQATKRIHQRKQRTIKHLIHDDKVVQLQLIVRSFKCKHCGLVFRETFPGIDRQRTTAHFREQLLAKARDRSFRAVALDHQVSTMSVIRTAKQTMKQLPLAWPDHPFMLGIDEHSFSGHDYCLTVTNLTDHQVIGVKPNNRNHTIRALLRSLTPQQRANIMAVCIDMHAGYRAVLETELPLVPIVIDPFHVIQHIVKHLTYLRTLYTSTQQRLPKRLLEKNQEDLTSIELTNLKQMFKYYPPLEEWWRLKEHVRALYRLQNIKTAHQHYETLLAGLRDDPRRLQKALYDTLVRWKHYILNYFKYRITNAYTEGIHTRMKLLKRISYGFRNKQHYIAKMMLAFLPWLTVLSMMKTST